MSEWIISLKSPSENMNEQILANDYFPSEGSEVIVYGRPTICCELDAEEYGEHRCVYRRKVPSYPMEGGNCIAEKWYGVYSCLDTDLEEYHMIDIVWWKYPDSPEVKDAMPV